MNVAPSRSVKPLEEILEKHRAAITAKHRVRNAAQLVKLVDAVGLCFAFTAADGLAIPACFDHLSTSDADRKWGWMWGWKDELAEKKRVYYGPVLARKPTFVSMRLLPVLYATFGRAGEPDDHVEDVRAGRMSDIGRRIIEYVTQRGESQTRRMRSELGITSKDGRTQYDRALDEVQRLMYVARVKAVGEGREEYNYTYDLFVRRYPEVVRAAAPIASAEARVRMVGRALDLAGALSERQASKLFDWGEGAVRRALERTVAAGTAVRRGTGREAIVVLRRYAGAD
ncbi:MAG: winged helix DNA-binding domain-containing protein [Chloroflexota bacterium]|nr:winged helix DNA-binding domain-containing protein [Chloroflexota bacterium]